MLYYSRSWIPVRSERKRSLFFMNRKRGRFVAKVSDQVVNIISPVLAKLGFELFDVEFVKEGKSKFLRIYIDKPGGITIEECVIASENISEALDQTEPDPIPEAYYLEVSSPGAERPLKTAEAIENAINEWVHLSFYSAVDGEKGVEGRLIEVTDDEYVLEVKDKTRRIKKQFVKSNVSLIRLAIEF